MLNIIKESLLRIVDDIDTGNSKISQEQEIQVLALIASYNQEEGMSKYEACLYLNISRATFDRYIKDNKLPKGKHIAGFKELRWYKKDLDKFIHEQRNAYK